MRTTITLAVILIALAIVAAVFFGGGGATTSPPPTSPPPSAPAETADTTPEAAPAPEVAEPGPVTTPADAPPAAGAATADAPPPAPPIEGLRAVPATEVQTSKLGELDADARLRVSLSSYGAALRQIYLADYYDDLEETKPYLLQTDVTGDVRAADGQRESRYPFAARGVWINQRYVPLLAVPWEKVGEGHYRVSIVDGTGAPVLDIERHYTLLEGTYSITCDQRLTSRTDRPLNVVWEQYGQGDVTPDEAAYMGDRRDIVTGYLDPAWDKQRKRVLSDKSYVHRSQIISDYAGSPDTVSTIPLWPTDRLPDGAELMWLASVNRYFAMVVHRPLAPDQPLAEAQLQSLFPRPDVEMIGSQTDNRDTRGLIFRLQSKPLSFTAAGQVQQLDLSIYAGPRKGKVFATPGRPYERLGFDGLIRFNLGGPCAFCTFQPLAQGLLWFLKGIHYVTRDWGIAIIVLVLVVRAILHPITKKAQVNMMRMGKQMQSLQPEIEKLKKKYKDDNQAMQKELMALYREKGINPANALGCLPMFLQMPIWIALYAMLYYAIELRHVPAFYDVFNHIAGLFGTQWHFLSDLSTADHFIKVFDKPRQINLWFIHPNFQAINILPILWGALTFIQQKLMTPPPANEQAEQTQKMMKWMTLLFPLMLYSAPSGLTLYILASTGAGIIDSWLVRKHVKKMEAEGTLLAPRKPSGLMARIAEAAAEKQRQLEAKQKQRGGTPRYKDRKR